MTEIIENTLHTKQNKTHCTEYLHPLALTTHNAQHAHAHEKSAAAHLSFGAARAAVGALTEVGALAGGEGLGATSCSLMEA